MSDQSLAPRNSGFSVVVPSATSSSKLKNASISRRFKNLIHRLEKSVADSVDREKNKPKDSSKLSKASALPPKIDSNLRKNSIEIKSPILHPTTNTSSAFLNLTRSPSESVMHLKNDSVGDHCSSTGAATHTTFNLPVQNATLSSLAPQDSISKQSCNTTITNPTISSTSQPKDLPSNLVQISTREQNSKDLEALTQQNLSINHRNPEYVSKRDLFTENEPVFLVGDLKLARNNLPKFVPASDVAKIELVNNSTLVDASHDTAFPSGDDPIALHENSSVASEIPNVHINPSFFENSNLTTTPYDHSEASDKSTSKHSTDLNFLEPHPAFEVLPDHQNDKLNSSTPQCKIDISSHHLPTPFSDTNTPNVTTNHLSTMVNISTCTSADIFDYKSNVDQQKPKLDSDIVPESNIEPINSTSTAPKLSTNVLLQHPTTEKKTNLLDVVKPSVSANLSGSQTSRNTSQMVYSKHDCGLNKYGKTTKIIGKGTGGTVRLLQSVAVEQRPPSTRNTANTSHSEYENTYVPSQQKLFAVKEFRKRRADETPRNYMKKVTSEFCIGSSLHHENVIETLDLIFEGERVFEIMEYCPYDLFKFVALGEMDLDETFCWFKQVCQAVSYIHTIGISHRDLKLENILLTHEGIVKLIDFGCATVFKAPFQKNPNKLTGVYGSDPYIAPEIFSSSSPYDAEASDVWSVGIMYICMTLLKFPWRIAKKDQEPNYASYVNNWPHGRDKLFAQLPALRDDGNEMIRNLVHPNPDQRPSLAKLLNSKWAQGIETCRPGKKARGHTHSIDPC
ncbi:hypothetical protein BB561_000973 [Smittium simulii]|uniref:Protein kinase domain-containing protein n=1 Tax=Smittium simulii TaxID=133385 RepID=A0A2T9YWV5_9FUNG|nr:hypothetical protein BB561_000973 [Smittium simulii]